MQATNVAHSAALGLQKQRHPFKHENHQGVSTFVGSCSLGMSGETVACDELCHFSHLNDIVLLHHCFSSANLPVCVLINALINLVISVMCAIPHLPPCPSHPGLKELLQEPPVHGNEALVESSRARSRTHVPHISEDKFRFSQLNDI